MQEEVNEKTIALCIRGGKITADILKSALIKLMRDMEKSRQKTEQKNLGKAEEKTDVIKHGKQSLDYSLKKDKSTQPPRYLVFFRAKDTDVMTAAFKEYTGATLQKGKKPSIRKRLQKAIERAAKHREREKTKQKDRGQTL